MEEEVQELWEHCYPLLPCCGSSLSPGCTATNRKAEKRSESRTNQVNSSESQARSAEDLLRFYGGSFLVLLRFQDVQLRFCRSFT